jgi:uncharacterized protein YdaU (DUF1376 family)
MTRKPDDWMPLKIGIYHADTVHLTRDQHGAYLLLLMAYWRRGSPLQANDVKLAAIVKASAAEWRKLRPVMAEFFTEKDGFWFQKRAETELSNAKRLTDAKAQAGRKGAESRWQKDGTANGSAMAEPSVRDDFAIAPSPSPIPKPVKKEATTLPVVAPSVPKASRGTSLPAGFPAQEQTDRASTYWRENKRPDLCPRVNDIAEGFRDHHTAKGTTSRDWTASWRTWCRNALTFERKEGSRDGQAPANSFGARLGRIVDRRANEGFALGANEGDGGYDALELEGGPGDGNPQLRLAHNPR